MSETRSFMHVHIFIDVCKAMIPCLEDPVLGKEERVGADERERREVQVQKGVDGDIYIVNAERGDFIEVTSQCPGGKLSRFYFRLKDIVPQCLMKRRRADMIRDRGSVDNRRHASLVDVVPYRLHLNHQQQEIECVQQATQAEQSSSGQDTDWLADFPSQTKVTLPALLRNGRCY